MNQRHAKRLVAAAMDFHERQPWNTTPADAPFMISLPGEPLPWFGWIEGGDSGERGLMLLRGLEARNRVAELILGSLGETTTEGLDFLRVTFEPLTAIAAPFDKILKSAKFKMKKGGAAPLFEAQRPGASPEPPGSEDALSLLFAFEGIRLAQQAGDLEPSNYTADSRGFLHLTVEGTLTQPTCRVDRNSQPPRLSTEEAPVVFPKNLSRLPRHEETWFLGLTHLDTLGHGETEHVLILPHAEGRQPSDTTVIHGGDSNTLRDEFLKVFRGQSPGVARGLPRKVIIQDETLDQRIGRSLAVLGVEVELGDLPPDAAPLLEDIRRHLESEKCPEASDLEGWKRAEHEVMLSFVAPRLGKASKQALNHYFGSPKIPDELFSDRSDPNRHVSCSEWLLIAHREHPKVETVLETLLADYDLKPFERPLLEARRDAHLSIFRVESVQPGVSADLRDVFSQEIFTVHDRKLSNPDWGDALLCLRLLKVGDFQFATMAGPILNPSAFEHALELFRELEVETTPDGLREKSYVFGRLFELIDQLPAQQHE